MVDSNSQQPSSSENGTAPNELDLDQFESVVDERGISLDELSQAYAALIGKGDDPYEPPEPAPAAGAEQIVAKTEPPPEDAHCDLCPRSIIEAILFVGHPRNEPISSGRLASLMRGVPEREISELVAELNAEYQQHQHPFHIAIHGAGYRMELREELSSLRSAFYGRTREARLSQAAIDVLAVVAYQKGCSRQQIERIRNQPSGGVLSQLVRRQLLRIERPADKPRTPIYYVTDRFLSLFGLAGVDELPQSQEMD